MSVRYERWLIARGNMFSPGAAAVLKLIERLREEKWNVTPGSPELAKLTFAGARAARARASGAYAVTTVENTFGSDAAAKIDATTEAVPAALSEEWLDDGDREELRLVWPVAGAEPLPVKYPLSMRPSGPPSWALEIHRSSEYVYPGADAIGAVPTACACGEDLAFEWDDEELVPAFAGSTGIFAECEDCSRTFDPSKGSATLENPFDGAASEVRGGAAYRFALKVDCGSSFIADARLAFAPELVALVEKHFGREFYEVGSTYEVS